MRERVIETGANARRRSLHVGGVVPFTATDYPGQLAAVVFVQGCPWRCRYCHNPHLQARASRDGGVSWQAVMDLLWRRAGLIDGVVFSGGEPCADPALADAIGEVRALGFRVGLHSAGAYPARLREVLPLLDWVGIDVKTTFDRYARITAKEGSARAAFASLEAVLASGVDYECRTTVHPELLRADEILTLAQTLSTMGVKRYALQMFRPDGCNDAALTAARVAGYPGERVVAQLTALFPEFTLREA